MRMVVRSRCRWGLYTKYTTSIEKADLIPFLSCVMVKGYRYVMVPRPSITDKDNH